MRVLTVGLLTAASIISATAAFAGEFEFGVRNRTGYRHGSYEQSTKIDFSSVDRYESEGKTKNETHAVKVDIVAPGPAEVELKYDNGKIKIDGFGQNTVQNPDPTVIVVDSNTSSESKTRQSGNSKAEGTQELSGAGLEGSTYLAGSYYQSY